MFSLKKKLSNQITNNDEIDLKDRLFFHDIINHTHGLILYLHQKESAKESISVDEVKMISNEIKTLQSLVSDHYNFKHKNLIQTFDWVPFSYAKLAFNNLVQTYLIDKIVSSSFSIDDKSINSDEHLIYYPSFYRILNNLVKNISESNCTHVNFEFFMNESGLRLISKNEMKVSHEKEIPEHLARVILNEKTSIEGLGLESIHHLTEENGGRFSFEIVDRIWINKLFLPTSKYKSDKKAA